MEICELYLKGYGKFHEHLLPLKEGVNIIYGGNETGKSTIHSFIRAMFFGLNRSRGKAARTDEYQIRQPWKDLGPFSGSMVIEEDDMVYLVERNFDKNQQSLSVTCQTTGEKMPLPEQTLEMLLGGMSETAFVNSVFIPQLGWESEEALSEELRRFMINSEQSLDGQIDVAAALQVLRKKKKKLESEQKSENRSIDDTLAQKQQRAEQIRMELDLLKQQMQDWPAPQREKKTRSYGKIILGLLLFLASIVSIGTALYTQIWQLKVFLIVFGGVFVLMMFIVMFFFGPSEHEDAADPPEGKTQDLGSQMAVRIRSLEEEYRNIQEQIEALYRSHGGNTGSSSEIMALNLAIDRICELSNHIYAQSGNKLGIYASEILREITGGKYDRIFTDEAFEVKVCSGNRVCGLHQVSGGTLQQIYFALRIAAGDLMTEGRELPIILDEAFSYYDDIRLELALRWLMNSGRQVILFTSQRREHQIMQKIKGTVS